MNCTLFDFIRSVDESEITPRLGFLPDVDDLQHLVRHGAFVFCFCPVCPTSQHRDASDMATATSTTTLDRRSEAATHEWQTRSTTHVRRQDPPREACHHVVNYGWPRAVQRRVLQQVASVTWRHCEAGSAGTEDATTGPAGQRTSSDEDESGAGAETTMTAGVMREVVHASRWALLDTPFVIERYQLVRVPPPAPPHTAASGAKSETTLVECELDGAEWRRARLVTTVCRVIVPPPAQASSLQGDCALGAGALTASLSSLTTSTAARHTFAHAFFNTCVALLPIIRPGCQRSWQKKDFGVTSAAAASSSSHPPPRHRWDCCASKQDARVTSEVTMTRGAHRHAALSRHTRSLSSSRAPARSTSVRSSVELLSGHSRSSSTEGATSSQLEPSTATTITSAATTTTAAVARGHATRRATHEAGKSGRSSSASGVVQEAHTEGEATAMREANGNAATSSHADAKDATITTTAIGDEPSASVTGMSLEEEAAAMERRLFATRPHAIRLRAMAMTSLLDGNKIYEKGVGAGWRRWARACGELCRPFIINLVDEVVQYSRCSRAAFYAAVAYLDRFVALCTDPVACCAEFITATSGDKADGKSERVLHDAVDDRSSSEAPRHDEAESDEEAVAGTRTFFTQVIAVCVMLGCKVTDLYPPRVSKLLVCLRSNAQITPADFVALELFVLGKLNYDLHTVTVNEVVDTLLCLSGGTAAAVVEAERHYRRLHELHHPELPYTPNVRLSGEAVGTSSPSSALQPLLCEAAHGVKEADTSETHKARPCSNEVWGQLCYLARFLCDLVIRGQRPIAVAAHDGEAEDDLLAHSPCLVGLAIVAVSAELHHIRLPAPLLHLLPSAPHSRPPGPCEESGEDGVAAYHHNNDESVDDDCCAACGSDETSPTEAAAECATARTRQPGVAEPRPCTSEAASDRDMDGLCDSPVRHGEDDYALLEYFAWLYCVAYHLPRRGLSHAASTTRRSDDQCGSAHESVAESVQSSSQPRQAAMTTTMQRVMAEVYRCYHHARDVSCDTLLQKRYRDMLLPGS